MSKNANYRKLNDGFVCQPESGSFLKFGESDRNCLTVPEYMVFLRT